MKFLVFAASHRKDSLNSKLAKIAAEILQKQGYEVDLAPFKDFDMPLYDGDAAEESKEHPPGSIEFKRRIDWADGVLIASPEFNNSFPGVLKNAIDWISTYRPVPIREKSIFLMCATPSAFGGVRGLTQLQVPLNALGAFVHPSIFGLAQANRLLSAEGKLTDEKQLAYFERMLTGFVKTTRLLTRKEL